MAHGETLSIRLQIFVFLANNITSLISKMSKFQTRGAATN